MHGRARRLLARAVEAGPRNVARGRCLERCSMSDATLFPLSDPQQVLASLVRAFADAGTTPPCALARARAARVAVSAYAGGAVGLAPRVAVARAGDGNAAGGDDGNAGRDDARATNATTR
jgi:membrane fusion protein (multidrug efflux system)